MGRPNSPMSDSDIPQGDLTERLIDPFGRAITYLRLSVTDRCNLRCTYCMAEEMKFLRRDQVLSLEEMALVAKVFVDLGVKKIRLTGGEPTVRKGVVDLARSLSGLDGLDELVMTTNGVLLDQFAMPLAEAGVKRLNISIDSLKPARFKQLTRFGVLQQVISGIDAARNSGFKRLKLNTVVLKGINDDEIMALVDFAIERNMDISFIEEMPLGHINSHERSDTLIQSKSIREQVSEEYALTASTESTGGPAKYFRIAGSESRIGFISPMSDNFCSSCNRVRLTVEGRLLLCLGHEHSLDLRSILHASDCSEQQLRDAIVGAIGRKPEKHHFDPNDTRIVRFMSATGG